MNKMSEKGIGLIEVVIGIAVITSAIVALTVSYGLFLETASAEAKSLKAEFLLEEGMEAVRSMRDSGWTNISSLTNNTPYYINFNGTLWSPTTVESPIDSLYYRTFILSDVYRDDNDDVASSGTLDALTRKVSVSVSWHGKKGTTTSSLETYVANIFINQ